VKNYEDWYLIDAWPGKRNVPTSCCLPEFANNTGDARFEVFTAVTMKNSIFWDVTPCGSCKKQCFSGGDTFL
jgi:hypothetical protein